MSTPAAAVPFVFKPMQAVTTASQLPVFLASSNPALVTQAAKNKTPGSAGKGRSRRVRRVRRVRRRATKRRRV